MTAVTKSKRLDHLSLGGTYSFRVMVCCTSGTNGTKWQNMSRRCSYDSCSKLRSSHCHSEEESQEGQEERLSGAFRSNYVFHSIIQCKIEVSDVAWSSDANQARLDFYLARNRKLAQWIKNRKLVPMSCGLKPSCCFIRAFSVGRRSRLT